MIVKSAFNIRRARVTDIEPCGRICYEAFEAVSRQHGFPCDFESEERARKTIAILFAHPSFQCLVAEKSGAPVGSLCMDERSCIAGIGPVSIDPVVQNAGVGTQLMREAMRRAAQRRVAGTRLLQATFNCRSMALYTKLGFTLREPLVVMRGSVAAQMPAGNSVRLATFKDLKGCNSLCRQVHGHDRAGELADAIANGTARVIDYGGGISAYSSGIGFFGHSLAVNNESLLTLITGVGKISGPGIIVPTRNTGLLHSCLNAGLRIMQPMSLMSSGLYNEPKGAYLPSIVY